MDSSLANKFGKQFERDGRVNWWKFERKQGTIIFSEQNFWFGYTKREIQ